jgi:hypothetical protein
MTEEEVEAFILSCGGHPMTPEEEIEFAEFLKPSC